MSKREGEETDWALELDVLAEEEAVRAAGWYDGHSMALGTEFESELIRALDQLIAHPQMHPVVDDGQTRRALLTRFPYAVYYQLEKGQRIVLVFAILHTSRNPEAWQQRVNEEG